MPDSAAERKKRKKRKARAAAAVCLGEWALCSGALKHSAINGGVRHY